MFLKLIQKAILYIKEIQEMALFAPMVNAEFFALISSSPAYLTILPLIGLWMTFLAVMKGYQLANADNKNFDKWFDFIIATACAVLSSISLYGAVISTVLGLSFAAGPWVFLSSVLCAFTHQAVMLGLNLFRAYKSPKDSAQRMHFIQAAINNGFIIGLTSAAAVTVIFGLLTPAAPLVASIFTVVTISFIAANMIWRMLPYDWKQSIKSALHIGKPKPEVSLNMDIYVKHIPLKIDIHHAPLFSKFDYSTLIKQNDVNAGTKYIREVIEQKIRHYDHNPCATEKNTQKRELLSQLLSALENGSKISKNDLKKQYSLALQSFWADKGEVEQILDTVLVLQEKAQAQEEQLDYSGTQVLSY